MRFLVGWRDWLSLLWFVITHDERHPRCPHCGRE